MKIIQKKYENIFETFRDNKDLNDILVKTLKYNENNDFFDVYEDIENLMSYQLLEVLGKTENDLNDDNNLNFITGLIKYMLLFKVNGGFINQWFRDKNQCLIIL